MGIEKHPSHEILLELPTDSCVMNRILFKTRMAGMMAEMCRAVAFILQYMYLCGYQWERRHLYMRVMKKHEVM